MQIVTILVPTDFSPRSDRALEVANAVARRHGSAVHVAHCLPFPDFAVLSAEPVYVPPQLVERLYERQQEHATQRLGEIEAKGLAGQHHLRREAPVDGILQTASDIGADLIVMGSHGAGASRFLLGSVAEKVARRSMAPVLVVREEREAKSMQRIVVGVRLGEGDERLLRSAATLVDSGGTIELVHVWTPPHLTSMADLGTDTEVSDVLVKGEALLAERLDALARSIETTAKVNGTVLTGTPASALLDRADELDADALVLGDHEPSDLVDRVLGTVPDRVLRHTDRPVLIVPVPAES